MASWVWTLKDTQCSLCWLVLSARLPSAWWPIAQLDLALPTLTTWLTLNTDSNLQTKERSYPWNQQTTWSTSLLLTPGKSPRIVPYPWTWRGYGRVTCLSYLLLTLNLRIGWRAKNLFFATFAMTKPPDGIMEPSSVNGKLKPHCAKVPNY